MKRLLASTVAVGALLLAGTAAADPAFTAGKPSVSAQLDYGIWTGDDIGDVNPYGLGLGARGGYTLDPGLYVGGAFDYFFGGSVDVPGAEVKFNLWTLHGEVGYDLGVAPNIVIRPKAGLGLTTGHAKLCIQGNCQSDSNGKMSLAPGAQALYSLDSLFLTAEARYNIVFDTENGSGNGLLFGVGAGLTF